MFINNDGIITKFNLLRYIKNNFNSTGVYILFIVIIKIDHYT